MFQKHIVQKKDYVFFIFIFPDSSILPSSESNKNKVCLILRFFM